MITTINEFKKTTEVLLNGTKLKLESINNEVECVFNILHSSDGITSPYGREYNLEIDDAVSGLIYFDIISDKYTEEELHTFLLKMKVNSTHEFGSRWSTIEVNKKIKQK